MNAHVIPAFAGRVLPVDLAVALRCARLHMPNRRPERDCLIAATALVHGMAVVTRNVADFQGTGVALLDPWQWSGTTRSRIAKRRRAKRSSMPRKARGTVIASAT